MIYKNILIFLIYSFLTSQTYPELGSLNKLDMAYMFVLEKTTNQAILNCFKSSSKLQKEVRVAITGAASSVFRSKELESALSSNFSASSIDKVSIPSKELNSDIHASSEYRAHIIKVMARKAVPSC